MPASPLIAAERRPQVAPRFSRGTSAALNPPSFHGNGLEVRHTKGALQLQKLALRVTLSRPLERFVKIASVICAGAKNGREPLELPLESPLEKTQRRINAAYSSGRLMFSSVSSRGSTARRRSTGIARTPGWSHSAERRDSPRAINDSIIANAAGR